MSLTDKSSVTQPQFRVHHPPGAHPASDPRVAFFNHHAPTWDQNNQEVTRTLERLNALRERLALRPGQDLLELGCGTGRLTNWLVDCVHPGRVVAADFSPDMLAQAQARKTAAEFWLLDICQDPPGAERFDVVFCFNAFPHFRDKPRALQNIGRLLKSGGRLLILHLAGSAHLDQFHSKLSHPVCRDLMPSPDQWLGLTSAAGLRLCSLTDKDDLFLLEADKDGPAQPKTN